MDHTEMFPFLLKGKYIVFGLSDVLPLDPMCSD